MPVDRKFIDRDARSVREAREWAAALLIQWGQADLVDTARLVVSELVTDSVRYGLELGSPRPPRGLAAALLR